VDASGEKKSKAAGLHGNRAKPQRERGTRFGPLSEYTVPSAIEKEGKSDGVKVGVNSGDFGAEKRSVERLSKQTNEEDGRVPCTPPREVSRGRLRTRPRVCLLDSTKAKRPAQKWRPGQAECKETEETAS